MLAMHFAIVACGGGGDGEQTALDGPAVPSGRVGVACIVKWTSGSVGTLACQAAGPNRSRAGTIDRGMWIDRVCVNDPRIASLSLAGGGVTPFAVTGGGAVRCAELRGVQGLPEACTCVPPAGGDCKVPPDGFVCLVIGNVPMATG